jgi:hypothetical protein
MRHGVIIARTKDGIRLLKGPDASLAECAREFRSVAGLMQLDGEGVQSIELHSLDAGSRRKRRRVVSGVAVVDGNDGKNGTDGTDGTDGEIFQHNKNKSKK